MWCCQKEGSMRLCPMSFGFAFGVTMALAIFISGLSAMFYGVPVMPVGMVEVSVSWTALFMMGFVAFIKATVFGVVVAMFYNYFSCCCRKMCQKHKNEPVDKV